MADGPGAPASGTDSRVMDFGSVFLASKDGDDASPAPSAAGNQLAGVNVAELLVGRGFATVVRHRDFEERSNYYDALLSAESRAISGKRGMHSPKEPPVMHVTDLLAVSILLSDSLFLCGSKEISNCFCFVSFRDRQRKLETFCLSCSVTGGCLL